MQPESEQAEGRSLLIEKTLPHVEKSEAMKLPSRCFDSTGLQRIALVSIFECMLLLNLVSLASAQSSGSGSQTPCTSCRPLTIAVGGIDRKYIPSFLVKGASIPTASRTDGGDYVDSDLRKLPPLVNSSEIEFLDWDGNPNNTQTAVGTLKERLHEAALEGRPVNIVAHSWGGVISYIAVRESPDVVVNKLITLDSPVSSLAERNVRVPAYEQRSLTGGVTTPAVEIGARDITVDADSEPSITTGRIQDMVPESYRAQPIIKPANVASWDNLYSPRKVGLTGEFGDWVVSRAEIYATGVNNVRIGGGHGEYFDQPEVRVALLDLGGVRQPVVPEDTRPWLLRKLIPIAHGVSEGDREDGSERRQTPVAHTPEEATVIWLYKDVLQREVDPSGLQTYTGALARGELNEASLRTVLRNSTEYQQRFGTSASVTPSPGTAAVQPQLSYSATSVPRGTTIQQPGSGFTPNSTVTIHYKKPDGTLYPPVQERTDAQGNYSRSWTPSPTSLEGEYQAWAVDDATGRSSSVVKFTVGPGQTPPASTAGSSPQFSSASTTSASTSQGSPAAGPAIPLTSAIVVPGSPEETTVRRLYDEVLRRPPDQGGLAYYSGEVRSGRLTEEGLRWNLRNSKEYADNFGAPPIPDDPNAATVYRVYRQVLHRNPDWSGYNTYTKFLGSGHTEAELWNVLEMSDEAIRLTSQGLSSGTSLPPTPAAASQRTSAVQEAPSERSTPAPPSSAPAAPPSVPQPIAGASSLAAPLSPADSGETGSASTAAPEPATPATTTGVATPAGAVLPGNLPAQSVTPTRYAPSQLDPKTPSIRPESPKPGRDKKLNLWEQVTGHRYQEWQKNWQDKHPGERWTITGDGEERTASQEPENEAQHDLKSHMRGPKAKKEKQEKIKKSWHAIKIKVIKQEAGSMDSSTEQASGTKTSGWHGPKSGGGSVKKSAGHGEKNSQNKNGGKGHSGKKK